VIHLLREGGREGEGIHMEDYSTIMEEFVGREEAENERRVSHRRERVRGVCGLCEYCE